MCEEGKAKPARSEVVVVVVVCGGTATRTEFFCEAGAKKVESRCRSGWGEEEEKNAERWALFG